MLIATPSDKQTSDASNQQFPSVSPQSVRSELAKILASSAFRHSDRLCAFLRFLVEETLAGDTRNLKEYTVAVEIYGRKPSFDPQADSIVRTEASRLRLKLSEYYRSEGQDYTVLIELPPRTYVPVFREREPASPAPPAAELHRSRFRSWIGSRAGWRLSPLALAAALIAGAAGLWILVVSTPNLRSFLGMREHMRTESPGSVSIAVLPFEDLSQTKDEEYFSDGLTEEIIEALATVRGLEVVSRTSSFQYKGRRGDIRKIGAELNAHFILEGSLRRQGDQLRIVAQLIDASDGFHVWSQIYERSLTDPFEVEEGVARGIANALRLELAGSRWGESAPRYATTLETYNLYLQGVFYSRRWSADALKKAIGFFEQATRVDPKFANAWAGLAESQSLLAIHAGLAPRETMPQAKAAALKAVELDPGLPEAHASLGLIKGIYEWDWKGAGSELRLAHELDPADARIHEAFVMGYLLPMGMMDEALTEASEARRLDPVSTRVSSVLGLVYYYRREYDKAIAEFRSALELDPQFYNASLGLGWVYGQKHMFQEAVEAMQAGVPTWATGVARSSLGYTYGLMGRASEARALLLELTELSGRRYISAEYIAAIHLGLGEEDEAFKWLNKAYDQRSPTMAYLAIQPRYDNLRSDPRFTALLKKIGLK